MSVLTAVEFFSGIGAFSEATRGSESFIRVIAAYDQNNDANATYKLNFRLTPNNSNLDSIACTSLPEARFWWLSPPCQPFSRRGNQLDIDDPRAAAFLNLLTLLPEHLPDLLILENVEGFVDSRGEQRLVSCLQQCRYHWSRVLLCPSMFSIPSRRPRVFYVASRNEQFNCRINANSSPAMPRRNLSEFLDIEPARYTILEPRLQERYERGFDIIETCDSEARTICFTSGYGRSMKVAGSFLRLPGGSLRRFSPEEILRILGFSGTFAFPEELSVNSKWKLAGNSVDITCIRFLLHQVGILTSFP